MPLDARVTASSAGAGFGRGSYDLAAEDERLELDLDVLTRLVAGAEPQLAEVERDHAATVARVT